jgi:hypothetical protein
MFIIRSQEPLKMNQSVHNGSFWTIELPLRLFYLKKASFFVTEAFHNLPALFTAALVAGPFELE